MSALGHEKLHARVSIVLILHFHNSSFLSLFFMQSHGRFIIVIIIACIAAKTLAIIVGLFVLCWLPFFTLYLIRPFCEDCINPYLFSVVFWIGYCNSAINPMIYALFSKDFRFAFKQIICKCFCSSQGFRQPSSRRGSDMSAMRHSTRTPSISPSGQAQSLGDDSDPIPEELHSRWRSYAPSISSGTSCGVATTGSLMGRLSINTSNVNIVTKNDTNVNNIENGKNNHSGGLTGLVVNGVNNSNGKGTTSVRASTVYDICHPLVM